MSGYPAASIAPDPALAEKTGRSGSREVVLLVEDNDCVAGLVQCVLDRSGCEVCRAHDGAECERLFAERHGEVGLVILDCRLPDGDGRAVGETLRAHHPSLPILFTSGERAARADYDDGLTSFLPKPFGPAQLRRCVDSLLSASL